MSDKKNKESTKAQIECAGANFLKKSDMANNDIKIEMKLPGKTYNKKTMQTWGEVRAAPFGNCLKKFDSKKEDKKQEEGP